MIKHIILPFLFCCVQILSVAQNQSTTPMITTLGEAIIYVAPDEVVLDIYISHVDKSLAEAKKRNDKVSNDVIAFCKKSGISANHIQTDYQRVGKNRRNRDRPNEYIEYVASQSISVCLRDLTQYSKFYTGILEFEIKEIRNSQFRTTDFRKYKDKARVNAIKAAKEKAVLLANELDQSIGSAIHIIEKTENRWATNPSAYNSMQEVSSTGLDGDQPFAPGQIPIKASIEVSFELKK